MFDLLLRSNKLILLLHISEEKHPRDYDDSTEQTRRYTPRGQNIGFQLP